MFVRNTIWSAAATLVLVSCSSGNEGDPTAADAGDDSSAGGAGGSVSGNGGSGGGGVTGAGAGGASGAGQGGAGGASAGAGAGSSGDAGDVDAGDLDAGPDPFEGLMRLPDVSIAKVASCSGAPDMSLCEVVTAPDRDYDVCVGGQCVSPGCADTSCNSAGPRFRMPPVTGHRYFERDAGDEPVVVDLITGLYWQGCFAGRSGDACDAGSDDEMAWDAAFTYCSELDWGGHDDWYLPDAYEWGSLYTADDSAYRDRALFPDAHLGGYTSVVDGSGAPWTEDEMFDDFPVAMSVVRCVRRGFSAPVPAERFERFAPSSTLSGELIVRDAATGLDWQACGDCELDGAPEKLGHAAALAYCDELEWAGFDDYRLPTVKEHLTTQSFTSLTGSTFNSFEAFKRGVFSHQAYWGIDGIDWILASDGSLLGTLEGSTYRTVCVRDND